MFDNLFDWEQPDNETLYYIKEYGKNELAKEKNPDYIVLLLY